MSEHTGMAQARLDEIQLRLVGADHRPWSMSKPTMTDSEGRRMVCKGSRKAAKNAIRAGHQAALAAGHSKSYEEIEADPRGDMNDAYCDKKVLTKALVLFKRSDLATDDMLEFICQAPEDIEDLLQERFNLHLRLEKIEVERDRAVKELLSMRVSAERAEQRIVDMRRAWRTLCKEMGTKP